MKNIFLVILFISISTLSFSQSMKEMFLPRWETTETYIGEITQLLGDKHLSYKATDSVMSAREHLVHIGNHLSWVHSMLTGTNEKLDWTETTTTEEILKNHSLVFEKIRKWTSTASEDDLKQTVFFRPANRDYSKNELLLLLLDHTRDHSGQLVVYLRLNGIEPPKYKGW